MSVIKRTIENTWKQILRSGWIAWSSVAVMTVAFIVGTVFAGLALMVHSAIQHLETRDNVIVFFEVGTDQDLIADLRAKWVELPQVMSIGYTTEEESFRTFYEYAQTSLPTEAAALEALGIERLQSTLDIRLFSLEFIDEVEQAIEADIQSELAELEYDPTKPPIQLQIDDESIEQQKEAYGVIRILMIVLLALLFIIIFFFVLMTVEYRTYNRMEEIGVMQLVGGSLAYIRAPYIIEGGLYGALGAFLSNVVIGGVWWLLFEAKINEAFAQVIVAQTRGVEIPYIQALGQSGTIAAAFVGIVAFGWLLGSLVSYFAIRRYIK